MAMALPIEEDGWEDILSLINASGIGVKDDIIVHPEVDQMKLREYQKVLANLAVERNIIACLPTGAGKTLIGFELAKRFLRTRVSRNQKVVFLAPTVPLTTQQFDVFQKSFSCVKYTGGHPVNGRQQFLNKTSSAQVIFFTPEIFRAGLESGSIIFQDICLLILDECHHAVKKNPMNLVMALYDIDKKAGRQVPRILGLSATIIKKNVNPLQLDEHIKKAETLLHSTAVTYDDYQEVQKHSTNAEIRVLTYTAGSKEILTKLLRPIQEMCQMMDSLPLGIKYPLFSSRASNPNVLGEEFTKEIERVLRDVAEAGDFGQLGLVISAARKLRFLDEYQSTKRLNRMQCLVCSAVQSSLVDLIAMAQIDVNKQYPRPPLEVLEVSEKVIMILSILAQYRDKQKSADALSGLIFVQTQKLAYCLYDILKEWIAGDQDLNGFIRPGLVVGAVNPKQVPVPERITKSKQSQVVERFRKKELNLLVTTSILEEGIDVPSCNLVIRVDPLTSYVSMIQSLGRARMKDAVYYVLACQGEAWDAEKKVGQFEEVNQAITEKLIDRMAWMKLA